MVGVARAVGVKVPENRAVKRLGNRDSGGASRPPASLRFEGALKIQGEIRQYGLCAIYAHILVRQALAEVTIDGPQFARTV